MKISRSPKPTTAVGDLLQLKIDSLAVGGAGVARHDGLVYFIPETAPGDLITARVTGAKKNYAEASLVKVLAPGPGRRAPPCVAASNCGGCNWQHLDQPTQVQQKKLILEQTLRKFLPEVTLPEIEMQKSPRDFSYRNRVQPRFQGGQLGYSKRQSHDFLPVSDCLIVEEPLRAYFQNPQRLGLKSEGRHELRLNENGEVEFVAAGAPEEGFGFSQVNRFQNEDLKSTVLSFVTGLTELEHIWDLYCGAGNFSFPLLEQAPKAKLLGVDLSSRLIQHARHVANQSRLSEKARFLVGPVGPFLQRRVPPAGALVLLDPPRGGAGPEVLASLFESDASHLIYISCHPVSLARDLSLSWNAARRKSWRIEAIKAFEMFPQTDHFETIVSLKVDSP